MLPPATAFKLSVVAGALRVLAAGLWRLTVRLVRSSGSGAAVLADRFEAGFLD